MHAKLLKVFNDNQLASVLALILAVLGFLINFGMFASVVVAVVTMYRGAKAGAYVMSWSLLPVLSSMVVGYFSLADLFLLEVVLVWLLSILLHRGIAWLHLLGALFLLATTCMVAVHVFVPSMSQEWLQAVKQVMQSHVMMDQLNEFGSEFDLESFKQTSQLLAPYMTSFLLSLMIFEVMLVMLVSQSFYTWLYKKQRADFLQLRLPMVYSLMWMICVALGMGAGIFWMIELMVIALPLFIFSGFSLFNAYMRLNPKRWMLLIVFYVLLLLCFPLVLLMAGLMGLVDSFVNFRRIWAQRKLFVMN